MADAELHIIVKRAGDPQQLGALVSAAVTMAQSERVAKVVVPAGYRCVECYRDDGGHDSGCSVGTMAASQARESRGAEE